MIKNRKSLSKLIKILKVIINPQDIRPRKRNRYTIHTRNQERMNVILIKKYKYLIRLIKKF